MSVHRVKKKSMLMTALIPRVLKSCSEKKLGRTIQMRKILAIRWLHLRTMEFVLQNRDLWIRPTELSWHFPIPVNIRELPFANYRGRSLAKLEARDETKKQKTQKNRKEKWYSARWKQSSWTWTTPSSSSAW